MYENRFLHSLNRFPFLILFRFVKTRTKTRNSYKLLQSIYFLNFPYTACPPNKFIRLIRLNKAKELLANPSLSIATIALDSGYNDPGYFARVFKQEYGVTPQEWRAGN